MSALDDEGFRDGTLFVEIEVFCKKNTTNIIFTYEIRGFKQEFFDVNNDLEVTVKDAYRGEHFDDAFDANPIDVLELKSKSEKYNYNFSNRITHLNVLSIDRKFYAFSFLVEVTTKDGKLILKQEFINTDFKKTRKD